MLDPAAEAGEDLEIVALRVHLEEAARRWPAAEELVEYFLEAPHRDALVSRHLGGGAEALGGEGDRRAKRREHVVPGHVDVEDAGLTSERHRWADQAVSPAAASWSSRQSCSTGSNDSRRPR